MSGLIINAGGSSGGGLNLKVVGGSVRPTGSENTIWVNTSTAINGYAFSATAPENPVEGMVWFGIGKASTAPINIDKKNTVMLYPVSCQQYVSGAWATKPAETYLNGSWTTWMCVLWDYGDNTAVSGGWGANNFSPSTTMYSEGGVSVDSATGIVYVWSGYESSARGASYTNLIPIDMTPFSTMAVYIEEAQDGWYSPNSYFGVTPARTGNTQWTERKAGVSMTPSAAAAQKVVTVDISNVNEPCYVLVAVFQGGGAADSESKIAFSKIELY